jgi:stearoyl-CoA desaturase (delta-9 desaturase)
LFAEDYRNGVRAWQWDPSKWFIAAMSWAGLAKNLKRTPWFKIQRALLDEQFRRAERQLATQTGLTQTVPAHIELLKHRVAEEYEVFSTAVADWTHLREQWLMDAKRAVLERWERSLLQSRLQEVEHKLKIQYQRMRVLHAQIAFTVA